MNAGTGRSRAAQMMLAPGYTEGGPDNRHRSYVGMATAIDVLVNRVTPSVSKPET
jgi:hypothetical protein